ncbi:MAG: hypothetical protein HY717_19705 [Planctomycetes bacterium]|nr:hypothetical protein [Planctomycetota bacterium]
MFNVLVWLLACWPLPQEGAQAPKAVFRLEEWLPYLPEEVRYQRAALPEEKNACLYWERIESGAFDDWEVKEEKNEALREDRPFPLGEAGEDLNAWLSGKEGVLERFERGAELGRYQVPEAGGTSQTGMGMKLMRVSELKLLRAKRHAGQGKFREAGEELRGVFKICRLVISGEGHAVDYLMGSGPLNLGLAGVRNLAAHEAIPDAELTGWIEFLEKNPIATEEVAQSLKVELCWFFIPRVVVKLPETTGSADLAGPLAAILAGELEKEAYRASLEKLLAALLKGHPAPFRKVETVKLTGRYFAQALENLRRPWGERRSITGQELKEEVEAWPEEARLPVEKFIRLSLEEDRPLEISEEEIARARAALAKIPNAVGKFLVREMLRDDKLFGNLFELLLGRYHGVRAEWEATRAVLALRLHARKHGRLPESWGDLIAERILSRAPEDPFSGRTLRYSRERKILWSAGPDGQDGGGEEWSEEGEEAKKPYDLRWEVDLGFSSF